MTSLTQLCLPMHRLGDTGMRNTEPKRWPSSNSWIGGESAAISSTMSLGNPEIIPRARSSSSRRPPRSPFLDNFRVADQPETIPFADTSAFPSTDPVKLPTNWLVLGILLRLIIRRPRLILETASSITVAKPRPRRLCKSALKCCLSGLKKNGIEGVLCALRSKAASVKPQPTAFRQEGMLLHRSPRPVDSFWSLLAGCQEAWGGRRVSTQ